MTLSLPGLGFAQATPSSAASSAGEVHAAGAPAPAPVSQAPAPTPSAKAAPSAPGTQKVGHEVKLHDTVVFRVWLGHDKTSAEQRAHAASAALEHALDAEQAPVRVSHQGEARVVFAADMPVIELFAQDAAAGGDASLDVHAARISARVRDVLRQERQRSALAQTVFHLSLVVFFGLLAVFTLRKLGELLQRARDFLQAQPERVMALRLHSLEVISAGTLRGLLMAALGIGRWVMLGGVVYVWLVFSFSLFEATQPYTERLTSFVFTPLSELVARVLSALPMGLLALMWGGLLYLLVRFAELWFASVARGETRTHWLPRDLLLPAGLLVRIAIVVLGLLFAGTIVTGDAQGTLGRAGSTILLALALATVPLLASAVVGVVQVFGRRMRVGQELSLGGRAGRVLSVGFLDVRLRARDGAEVRVPHLLSLWQPISTGPDDALLELCVAADQDASAVRHLLLTAATQHAERAQVELQHFDADGLSFRVQAALRAPTSIGELRLALCEALRVANVPLGRAERGRSS